MKSFSIYFILTFIGLQLQAQEVNEVIQGKWILSSIKEEPYLKWNDDFAVSNVLSDSAIKLIIADNTIEVIVFDYAGYDTSIYNYSLSIDSSLNSFDVNLYHIEKKKRKKKKHANTLDVIKMNNSGMLIRLGHFDFYSPFFNYSSTQYYFKKTIKGSNTVNEKTIEGNWFINDTTDFYSMDTIKLKRDSCTVKTENFEYRITVNFHTSIDDLDCFSYDKRCLNCSVLDGVYISPCSSWKINPSASEINLTTSNGQSISYVYKLIDDKFMLIKKSR